MHSGILAFLLGFTLYLAVMGTVRTARGDTGVDVATARTYLVGTSTPGGTMVAQGVEKALECLHPKFALALAAAVEEARARGLAHAGVYSACRPPVLGVGGFHDKHQSLHAYGLAVDMAGIGRPGSSEAQLWSEVAKRHGLTNPYGYRHRVEWNHWQASPLIGIARNRDLRRTITKDGPIDLETTWAVAQAVMTTALGGALTDATPAIAKKVVKKKKTKKKAVKKSKAKKQKAKRKKGRRR
jgi:hypothetical protein